MAAMCCDARARARAAWSPATETLRLFQAVGAQKTTHTSRLPAFSTSSIQLTARLHSSQNPSITRPLSLHRKLLLPPS